MTSYGHLFFARELLKVWAVTYGPANGVVRPDSDADRPPK